MAVSKEYRLSHKQAEPSSPGSSQACGQRVYKEPSLSNIITLTTLKLEQVLAFCQDVFKKIFRFLMLILIKGF